MNFIKNTAFIILIVIVSISDTLAQKEDSLSLQTINILNKKFYYQMGVGYNFSSGIGTFNNYVENSDYSTSNESFIGSFGKGLDISYGLGYKITKNLGIELELGYTYGAKNIEKNQYYDDFTHFSPVTIKQTIAFKANTVRLNPKLLFEIPFEKGNAFYAKFGYLIGSGNSKITADENWVFDSGLVSNGVFTWKQTGGMVSGSTTALGFRFFTQENISFFMELTGNNLHRTFKKSSLIESIENNINTLDSRPTYYKEIIFVDNLVTTSSGPDITQPRELLAFRSNYSTVGFRIGFISHF